jgi:LysM repeat protein
MSSIRPLVTITILVVVGAFLYVKINEGPVAPPVTGANELSMSQTSDGVPPLSTTTSVPTADASAAPLWPTTATPVAPATTGATSASASPGADAIAPPLANVTTTTGEVAAGTPPAVPAIPELPAVAATADAAAVTATNAAAVPNPLSTNIPVARYPEPTPETANASNINVGASQSITSANPSTPIAANTPGSVYDVMAPQANVASAAPVNSQVPSSAGGQNAVPGTAEGNPLAQSNPPSQTPNALRPDAPQQNILDNHLTNADAVNDSAVVAGAPTASFASSWPAIQTALERGDLAEAHQLLSPWHDDSTLNPADAKKVDSLLSQLAGTVIYSTEHRLQPARVVKPGESLETIAKEYNVPWQLLAKINGIPAANLVRPGQELKVVPGPFSAIVDLGSSQLTLLVDGRYAGKFPITVPIGATVSEGAWLVDQKLMAPASVITQSAYSNQPARVDHAIMLRSGSEEAATEGGPTLAIASSSAPTAPGASAPAIQVSAADAEELSDILSIGSRVIIRR